MPTQSQTAPEQQQQQQKPPDSSHQMPPLPPGGPPPSTVFHQPPPQHSHYYPPAIPFSVPHRGGAYGKSGVEKLDESNKGHQMLKRMGWGGAGLGAKEQGIEAPISGGEVREREDLYKGVGVSLNDPYENFRKSKKQAFISRMKERQEHTRGAE
ncbi:SURP and G-patch domain-containing protein 1-like protein [Diaphorina citri]|uniref:SURP and G-patch domain-containing protein 1-like protein n=1 Tax=Diaphorina citri TaxID=121845 RepID=A0A3Q0IMB0_DIACI|nr:SURP and G-patch domain-containing protein 1-like protein [Diaphorina citri]